MEYASWSIRDVYEILINSPRDWADYNSQRHVKYAMVSIKRKYNVLYSLNYRKDSHEPRYFPR